MTTADKVQELRMAAQRAADRLEAWAETHERSASTDFDSTQDHKHTADNYRFLVEDLREAIAASK